MRFQTAMHALGPQTSSISLGQRPSNAQPGDLPAGLSQPISSAPDKDAL
jgi:hypothetical protein